MDQQEIGASMADHASESNEHSASPWEKSIARAAISGSNPLRRHQDQPLNRACEACRISKVRCLANPDSTSVQCQRCARAGRTCVFAPPVKRRQRKRTDVRVTELEKEIHKMRSLLKTSNKSLNDVSDPGSDDEPDQQVVSVEPEASSGPQSHTSAASTATGHNGWFDIPAERAPVNQPLGHCNLFGAMEQDIIDRDVISEDMARELLGIWRDELTLECPGITIPKHWTVFDLRDKKPALFHAVMAAAAQSKGSTLSDKLHDETVYFYARSAFIRGEKSVQAIQALLVTVTYYSPSKTTGQLQILQWVNMAASMALELGLTSKPRTHEQLPKRAIRSLQKISSPEELLEHVRIVLLLYINAARLSMRLKRPNILLFNSWMEECFIMLQKSKSLEDKRIVAQLKLQRIADEANTAFGFDDASTSFSLSELRMQIILRIFDRRMQDWRKSVPDDTMTPLLNIEFHQNMLSMWEFGMDGGCYDVVEFRNQHVSLPALDDDSVQPESLLSRTALQINATTKCISAAQTILDYFLDFPNERVQKAPNVLYARAVFSLVTLMKADYAVGTDEDMSELLESQSLRTGFYLDMVLAKIADSMGPQKCRIASHWNFLLETNLKSWWDEYQQWRKEGRHLKRRKTKAQNESDMATGNQTPLFADPKNVSTALASTTQTQPPLAQQEAPLASYPMSAAYPAWNATNLPLNTSTPTQATAGPGTFSPDMGDFSAAFQNGDLYLWNDVSVDSFGGWSTQISPYNSMGYGPSNGQGF